jgi:3-oxoacyl-[acyl-carrier-protein] synthase-3
MSAYLRGIQYCLPEQVRRNEDLAAVHRTWDPAKFYEKTGIRSRRIASVDQTAGDLGYRAAERLLDELSVDRDTIGALIFCTQSPDFFLPTTACLLQERLGLPTHCGAFDYNLGCSGFTYGLWLSRSLILSNAVSNVLLIVADTYSKYCDPDDLTTAPIFGDAGAAALISAAPAGSIGTLGPTVVGTDGRGASNLIVRAGGARLPKSSARGDTYLYMNGPEVFSFTLSAVKVGIQQLLDRLEVGWDEVDLFLFHQANRFLLQRLQAVMKIPDEKLPIDVEDVGNTVSASIPLLIRRGMDRGLFRPGQRCVMAGFGVGYSWAMSAMTWGVAEGSLP